MFVIKTGLGYVYDIGLDEEGRVDEHGRDIVEVVTYRDDLAEAHLFWGDEWVLDGSDLFEVIAYESSEAVRIEYIEGGEVVRVVTRGLEI